MEGRQVFWLYNQTEDPCFTHRVQDNLQNTWPSLAKFNLMMIMDIMLVMIVFERDVKGGAKLHHRRRGKERGEATEIGRDQSL